MINRKRLGMTEKNVDCDIKHQHKQKPLHICYYKIAEVDIIF